MAYNGDENIVCKCLCFYLIDKTYENNVQAKKLTIEEEKFLIQKAKALSNFLFLKDDIYAIETVKFYDKKAIIQRQPLQQDTDHKMNQIFPEELQLNSQTIQAYIENYKKQLNRYALLTVLNKIIEPVE
ncbi:unnamed protein product [Trichobilharzia szidati]|nr:unnamed protein product [Trichobilharzia szidati]